MKKALSLVFVNLLLAAPAIAQTPAQATPNSAASAVPAPGPSPTLPPENPAVTAKAKAELAAWQSGKIDRTHYTDEMNSKMTDALIAQISPQVAALGTVRSFKLIDRKSQPPIEAYVYEVVAEKGSMAMVYALDKSGKITGLYFRPLPAN